MNIMTEERSVECPKCSKYLHCYGYHQLGTVNCCHCGHSFIITEEIWKKSYLAIVKNSCYSCGHSTSFGITAHDHEKKEIQMICLRCSFTLEVNY
ncbi:MAG: hypothetical protein ACTSP4_00190 [Candidatus Hodarchaeales archaeon]